MGIRKHFEKIIIFKSSRLVVYLVIYNSGGMVACEAMSCGLPGVSFDLEALKTYYPKGMIKVMCYDLDKFVDKVIQLMDDEALYCYMKADALAWANEWGWPKRCCKVLHKIELLYRR